MASALIARRKTNTLILVHRQPLVDQWKARLVEFLGLEPKQIGIVAAGKSRRNGLLDVAMVQSLVRDSQVEDWISEYGMVIVDECHHVPAVSVEKVLKEVKSRFVHGLTATPRRKDGLQKILHHQCGPIVHTISETKESSQIEKILVLRETGVLPPEEPGAAGIQSQFGALAANSERTEMIVSDVRQLVDDGFHPLILTERIEHLEILEGLLRPHVGSLVVLQGGGSAKVRRERTATIDGLGDNVPWAILATGRYVGEGFDEPRLDALVLAMPISWKGTLTQYAGRILRQHPGKEQVRILDYIDDGRLLQSMARKRRTVWRSLGFRVPQHLIAGAPSLEGLQEIRSESVNPA
jgi:superfamily II DNA or RNA helicase